MLKMILSGHSKGDSTMFALSRNFLKFTAASSLLALTAISAPASAYEMAQNLGPVGPHEPILTTVGNKRVIAFYEPDNGQCVVNAVVYDKTDADTGMTTAARVRVSLAPGQTASIDSAENKSLTLECGDRGEMLSAVDTNQQFASK
jgi:hypothetical protein